MDRIEATAVAKIVRSELKAAFPTVKFGVRTAKYSGGSSIHVRWTDGPTTKQVEYVAGKYHGAEFDGMIDLKSYTGAPYRNDYIFFERDFSPQFEDEALRFICRRFGFTLPQRVQTPYGAQWDGTLYQRQPHSPRDLRDEWFRCMSLTPAPEYQDKPGSSDEVDAEFYNFYMVQPAA